MLIQQLTYLSALARERHFGRAATACHVSQPTLSAGIQRLEAELGVPLVLRGRRFEGLTPEGARLLEWVHRILTDVDGMRSDLGAMREGLSGRVRIGAIPTALPITSLLTQPLCDRHPALDLSVLSMSSREIEQGLHDARLDVGLTYLDNEPLRDVRTLELYQERYFLLTPSGGPFADAATVAWEDAAATRLCLLSPDMQNRRIVDRIFRDAGTAPRPMIETNSITALYGHVHDGIACAVVSHAWLYLVSLPEGMRAIPLTKPTERHAIGMVWLDRDPESLLARAFVESARDSRLEELLSRPDGEPG
jgi:DNA-binding transcriptional LysR family regulator